MILNHLDLKQILGTQWVRHSPLLPEKELHGFVAHYFNRRDRYLRIFSEHSEPLYLLDTSVLKTRAAQFKKAFQAILPSVGFYYAVKSNNHPVVAQTLLDEGFGLDVSSGIELEMALNNGADDIIFSGPGKTARELQSAVSHEERVVVLMDSFGELRRLNAVAAECGTKVRAGIRLCVEPTGLWRKFGVLLEDLFDFLDQAGRCRWVQLIGLQFHCSWNLSPDKQIEFIRVLGDKLADLPSSFKNQLEFIDIGGGYWPRQGEWLQPGGTPEGALRVALGESPGSFENHHCLTATPIEVFAEKLGAAVGEHLLNQVACRIFLEPGRWICNDAVHLLMSVVDKKAPGLVITDAGTNAVGWERFETDYFPILNLSQPSLDEKPCHVLGSLCTPHDVWGYMYFGKAIEEGDILMIPTQGAYTYSLRQHFIKPLPRVHIF